jgi:hypothetical protein
MHRSLARLLAPLATAGLLATTGLTAAHAEGLTYQPAQNDTFVEADHGVINHLDTVTRTVSCPNGTTLTPFYDGTLAKNQSSAGVVDSQWSGSAGGTSLTLTFTNWNLSGDQTTGVAYLCNGNALPPAVVINDNDPGLRYGGAGWGYYPGRPSTFGDLQNDVHATPTNGDSVSYTFTGRGIGFVSEKSDGYGLIDVYLDGALVRTVDANLAHVNNLGGQTLFQVANPTPGQHTLRLVKKSGGFMVVDALVVQP